ncbi:hypothetical protein WR52_12845 [Bacillus cereus]|uniref:hypothetical protein n=1 Tax=Bacillus cereus TaxID=1396 RepID=UPI0007B6D5C5|nr:hypothetical protein [Bacillus cereus]MRC28936.1 hypothetical protein [Bacillus thuringiensis]ANC19614.1 hypothetical protein WR52_12845 [Bacillus cereus]MDA2480225.1 hypothetical protein [Bacillus cereus]MDA2497252.1 hypothetical protein [Bacillus cereus]HDR8043526.1 hypothetical protein [Bacillus cereus]
MYKEHRDFELPENNPKIWRYMDFTKFMDMLDKESIFFTRADKFQDKFEGTYPPLNKVIRPHIYKNQLNTLNPEEREEVILSFESFNTKFNHFRKFILINCWHMNEYESAAMWNLYLKSDEGIAIQSNVERLIKSFGKSQEKVHIGKVEYIDYKLDIIPEGRIYLPFMHKRKSFEHEHELRVLHLLDKENGLEYGMPIKCDISELIEKIYVAPTAPDWLFNLVDSMCKKFNLNVEVERSELSGLPR